MPDSAEEDVQEPLVLSLQDGLASHAVDASVFLPFVVARLSAEPEANSAELWVRVKEESSANEKSVRVRLTWEASRISPLPAAIQEHVITEWAALGVACVLLPALTG